MTAIDLNGRRMRVAAGDPHGVVSESTVLIFEQAADVVSGRYRGGAIVTGHLVGRLDATGCLRFCYAQTDRNGNIDAGISTGTVEALPDGRLRVTEVFQWLTRSDRGINVFEEIDRQPGEPDLQSRET